MDPPLIVADLLASAISEKEQRQQTKESAIRDAVRCRDRQTLVKLARSKGGLVNDSLRKIAWPFLLGCDADAFQDPDWKVLLPAHPEEAQVRLDTDRAFHFYPESRTTSPATSDDLLCADRDELFDIITHILRLHPSLSYFQGFHDIAQVLYLVLGRRHAVTVLEHLSLTRLRDFMMPDIEPSVDHLSLIPALLAQIDRPLADVLKHTRPHYALATILTMFAHVIESYSEITLVFDFFFSAADMALPVYLYVVILISRRDELLAFQKRTQADPEKEQDEEDIHETAQMLEATISRFPQPLPLALSDALSRALALWMQYPPHTLTPAYDKISKYSVLKTLREPTAAEDMYSGVEQLDGEDEKRMVSRRERIRRRRKRMQDPSSTSSSPRPSRRSSSASVVEEYDYIELDRVHKPADYTALDALVARQTSECKKRAARERARVERQRAREARERKQRAVRERRSATRRLAEQIPGAVATLYRRGVGADEGDEESVEGGEADTLDGSLVLLGKPADMQQASSSSSSPTLFTAFRRARPPTAQVNGTATTLGGVRRFKFADARRTITALSPSSMMAAIGMVSFCIGVLSWWVSWFLRRDY